MGLSKRGYAKKIGMVFNTYINKVKAIRSPRKPSFQKITGESEFVEQVKAWFRLRLHYQRQLKSELKNALEAVVTAKTRVVELQRLVVLLKRFT